MSTMQEPPDSLDPLLDRWGKETPPLPGHLTPEVWRRISVAETPDAQPTGLLASIHAIFARPSFSIAFVSACILLGLFLAEVRRSHAQSKYNAQLMQSYLHLIDPLLEQAPLLAANTPSKP